ncbi:branched chain amino acid/phenylalanine ABC transporter ATP binding subunit LivG [Paraburkholderia unamae]|uniref:ABC transporter ATP-binding protein n=1 Tax=Paraburkholderia unamae TaxID=219649 RepID=UPI001CAAE6F5|nr:ABC transporter ATP-binding protein [Paraburkholderia unamae]CAG9251963.1 branched chain amino acid/phenylalanine ABC transporter ATP binding subunit LivG [Paraburkholderia unamae]
MNGAGLVVSHVSRRFGGVLALNGVSFAVRAGEIKSVIGPNGAGKSTLLNILSGVTAPSSGTVSLDGRRIERLPAHRRVAAGIARTFQNLQLFSDMSVLENVMVGAHTTQRAGFMDALCGSRKSNEDTVRAQAFALDLLAQFGLKSRAHSPAHALSYGEAKLLEIARAMASRPRMLLLDEPLAGLPYGSVKQVAEVVRALNRAGTSIVLVEHNVKAVMQLSDSVVVLANGEFVSEGTPDAIRSDRAVIDAYLGEPADAA